MDYKGWSRVEMKYYSQISVLCNWVDDESIYQEGLRENWKKKSSFLPEKTCGVGEKGIGSLFGTC